LQVPREVIGGEEIGFRAEVPGSRSGSRTEHSRGLVVDRIVIGRAPEKILQWDCGPSLLRAAAETNMIEQASFFHLLSFLGFGNTTRALKDCGRL